MVTAPDQPTGRGLQVQPSPVKVYASARDIPVLQPEKLRNEEFLSQLRAFHADLFIVVAFRMLPEAVWNMPHLGTFNLHASLLPDYRGAAPIHHAIMNGETETGITTFFLQQEIDTGKIIFQEKMAIHPDETTGELHDRMKVAGARLAVKTVEAILSGNQQPVDQALLIAPGRELRPAPKIFREDCRIDWTQTSVDIYNKIRGLCPVPAAFTTLVSPSGEPFQLKIYKARVQPTANHMVFGTLVTDGKQHLAISSADGLLFLEEVQLAGKRRMSMADLLRGFRIGPDWKVA